MSHEQLYIIRIALFLYCLNLDLLGFIKRMNLRSLLVSLAVNSPTSGGVSETKQAGEICSYYWN